MANATSDSMFSASSSRLPELPSYTLSLKPQLIFGIPDVWLQLALPIIAYWVTSLFFHLIDELDLFPQYRLHTPAEILKRNRVTRWEVFRDVILQQIIQTAVGLAFAYLDPAEMVGREQYDIAVWALRLRKAQAYIPTLLKLAAVDSSKFSPNIWKPYPTLAAVVSGGVYPFHDFAHWELQVAKFIYWVGIPLVQFTTAVLIVDTWQYFLHRAMHMNKFLYNWLHIRHHRLYVPYAFGALYNHPIEGFMLDTLGTGIAYLGTGMTIRQGLCLFTCATIKTVDDHCGYAFPWDPLQHVSSNNAAYHDIHHQSWGIKTNFSQPFFTFWDRFLGTVWKGGDVSSRYQRDRIAAQRKVDADKATVESSVVNSPVADLARAQQQAEASQRQVTETDGPQVIREEQREEQDVKQSHRRSTRRKSGFDAKALSDRVAGSLHGRSSAILHADGVR